MDTLKASAFNLLCVNLGFPPTAIPDPVKTKLEHLLDAAQARLKTNGIPVDNVEDAAGLDLLVMYAEYLYRRRDSTAPMPLSLRLAINDAKVAAITKGAET